ncbi:MAG TPA: HD domain-containing protein [Synergistaceae bacterium]|nr:HD domain-containing protein [Synergistaceae bacterium]HQF91012.1 HD domain-containing protein [Synergistaceae bacterium]HQH77781.1 HD domain-containing protein [Synergistaceae bacterium]HQK24221.1 HD domain-containing protein [Synergistaceae bacterium]
MGNCCCCGGTEGMGSRIEKLLPEIAWITDEALRGQVVATYEDALKTGGWEPEDMETIPFTLLIPDCPASYLIHTRGVTRMAKVIYEEFNSLYKENGGFQLDHDLLIAGALLHDVGKLVEYEKKDGKVVKSKMGKDLRHPFSGTGLAMRNGVPSRVCHCIAVHAHEGDDGYRCPEAVVINKCDFVNFETIKSFLGLLK